MYRFLSPAKNLGKISFLRAKNLGPEHRRVTISNEVEKSDLQISNNYKIGVAKKKITLVWKHCNQNMKSILLVVLTLAVISLSTYDAASVASPYSNEDATRGVSVDKRVLDSLKTQSHTSVIVMLKAKPHVTRRLKELTKAEASHPRVLMEAADENQEDFLRMLDDLSEAEDLEVSPFWIANYVTVTGVSKDTLRAIVNHDEVYAIHSNEPVNGGAKLSTGTNGQSSRHLRDIFGSDKQKKTAFASADTTAFGDLVPDTFSLDIGSDTAVRSKSTVMKRRTKEKVKEKNTGKGKKDGRKKCKKGAKESNKKLLENEKQEVDPAFLPRHVTQLEA